MQQSFVSDNWVIENFGDTDLKDERLNTRLVRMVKQMAVRPEASLPMQLEAWSEIKAGYRLLNNKKATHGRIQKGHRQFVKRKASNAANGVVLHIQDGTELDYSTHMATRGLGPIGNHTHQGMMIHSCLAVRYEKNNPEVLGLAHQQVWKRKDISLCKNETRAQRNNRKVKESKAWLSTLNGIGSPPKDCKWVSIGDRGSDIFEFISGAKQLNWDLVVRACQDRKVDVDNKETSLMDQARSLPVMGSNEVVIRKKGDTKPKKITVNIAWSEVTLHPPARFNRKYKPITISVVRCWNDDEEIDWILSTTIAVKNLEEALEKIEWYTCRWIIEEYHKCLKTGCRMESSQLETSKALETLLGILAILALLMLQLRDISREEGERLAVEVAQKDAVSIVCKRYSLDKSTLTVREFWRSVARLGGFIGRRSDGDPGWQTLWKGWLRLLDMLWATEALTDTFEFDFL